MASGSLAFDNEAPAAGEAVKLTVSVTDFQNNAISLQVDPDPGDGSNGKTIEFEDPSQPSAEIEITAGNPGTTYTFTLMIDGKAAVDDQKKPVTAQLEVEPPVTTTAAVVQATTAAPPASTTVAPVETTTAAPEKTTTVAPVETTTAAPEKTTTVAPASSTTAAANASTTAAASASTTAAASASTTAAASASTTAAASASTTAAASASTTAGGDAPVINSVTVVIDPPDDSTQNPHSVQVANDAKLKVQWDVTGGKTLHVENLEDFDLSSDKEADLDTRDATYVFTAIADGGAKSDPWTLEIHTHEPGQVVSPHVDVGSGVAAIISFQATKDDAPVHSAVPGDALVFELVASDAADSAKINDQDAELGEAEGGQRKATLSVTVTADMDGHFTGAVFTADDKDKPADSKVIQLDVVPTTTTAAPASTTTSAASTTTQPASTTTQPASTTTHPASTTTTPASTTTGATSTTTHPASTTTHPASTTTHPASTTTAGAGLAATLKAVPAVADGTDTPVSDDKKTVNVKLGNWVVFTWKATAGATKVQLSYTPDGADKPVTSDQPLERGDDKKLSFRPPKSGDIELTFTAMDDSNKAVGDPAVITIHADGKLFTNLRWQSPGLIRGSDDHILADTTAPDGTWVDVYLEARTPRYGWVPAGLTKDRKHGSSTPAQVAGGKIDVPWTKMVKDALDMGKDETALLRFRILLPDPAADGDES